MIKQRLLTALMLVAILIPIISIPELLGIFEIVMILFVVFASRELLMMFEKKETLTPLFRWITIVLTLVIYISVAGFLGINQTDELFNSSFIKAIIPVVVVLMLIYFVLSDSFKVVHVGSALLVMTYIGFGAAAITVLRFLGIRFIFYMVFISTMTDTFAYLIGMRFGKHPLAPTISPKKTWEGAIGGTIIATVISSGFALFYGVLFTPGTIIGDLFNASGLQTLFDQVFPSNMSDGVWTLSVIILTFSASIVSQFGDLFASKLKRHYDIKDFSNIFPGHGGIMDRFDSMIMVSMYISSVLYIFTQLI